MRPTLCEGDYIITKALFADEKLLLGDIVVFDHPDFGYTIKSVTKVESTRVMVGGTSALSISSQHMGWISRNQIKSRLIFIIGSRGVSRRPQ